VWATVAQLDSTVQERLADVLETRGADPRQQDMRRRFLADVEMPAAADVLDVGCGTGVGKVGDELAEALKAEARRRVAAGRFFGHIAYASVVARKRAQPSPRRSRNARSSASRVSGSGGGSGVSWSEPTRRRMSSR
jgi:hypothetical protein